MAEAKPTNIVMTGTAKASSAHQKVRTTTNIKKINIKMMNIIIKLKTRIKKKISEMKGIESKTTDKNKIIEGTTASPTNVKVKTATDKKSKIIMTTQSMTKSTTNTVWRYKRRKRNSIELRIQINNKIASNNLSNMMKKM